MIMCRKKMSEHNPTTNLYFAILVQLADLSTLARIDPGSKGLIEAITLTLLGDGL